MIARHLDDQQLSVSRWYLSVCVENMVQSGTLALAFGSMIVLLFAVTQLKSACNYHGPPTHLTDLHSLVSLLHQWESESVHDALRARAVSRVASDLQAAIEAQHAAVVKSQEPAASPPPPAGSGAAASAAQAFQALALAGMQCNVRQHVELWGDPVVWGDQHRVASAAECCAACAAHQAAAARGGLDKGPNSTLCNTWVFCGNELRCGNRYGECWLKHQRVMPPPEQQQAPQGGGNPWTSGLLYTGDGWLAPWQQRSTLTLHFALGDVAVQLLPELAPVSVRELRRLAALIQPSGGYCRGCRLYRVETNFLVQGVIQHPGGYVASPRHPNPPQKKIMERGLVCWAGGMGGPDLFVNLIDQAGFGDDHLCWGKVADMALLDAIVKLPTRPKAKPNEMTFLAQELRFNITLA